MICAVHDVLEATPPPPGRYRISDGNAIATIDTTAADLRAAYAASFEARRDWLGAMVARPGLTLVGLSTEADPAAALARGLAGSVRRRARGRAA